MLVPENTKTQLKITMILTILLSIILATGFSLEIFQEEEVDAAITQDVEQENAPRSTLYTVQDSQGNILSTTTHFKSKSEYDIFIKNQPKYPKEKIDAIIDAIISTETIEIENHKIAQHPIDKTTTFYKGWAGAGKNIEDVSGIKFFGDSEKIRFVDDDASADITIIPTDLKSGDGSLGWTNSIINEKTNEITKATITLYEFDKSPIDTISIVVRHEIGHALGLGHSSDPNDLMYATIETTAPYISHCDILGEIAELHGKDYSYFICDEND